MLNTLISKSEQKSLPPYLQELCTERRQHGGKGTRVSVHDLVADAAERAKETWAKFNPPAGRDARFLSRFEIKQVAKKNASLGELTLKAYERMRAGSVVPPPYAPIPVTDATYTSTHPNARLERKDDFYVLTSDTSGRVASNKERHRGILAFSGQQVELDAETGGLIPAYRLANVMPEGFSVEDGTIEREGEVLRNSFRIFADPPGTLSTAEARAIARAGLLPYIRDVRMHATDWQTSGLPNTWEALVAAGIEAQIASFGEFPARSGDIQRRKDSYLFAGRGPLGLYTEVEVSKIERKVIRIYVEID